MAGKSLIGALRVFLGLDTAQFTEGAGKAKDALTDFVETTKNNLERLAAAFAVEQFVQGFINIEENLNALGKAAQKIGIPVEQLAELQYAAELADVPIETLQGSIAKFSKGLSEFAATGKGQVGVALKEIGVSATDANGKLKPQIQLLEDIAEKFAGYRDGANKTALAMALFGKAGAELIPLFNEGSKGIKEAGDQLLSFGGVPTEQATEAAHRLLSDFKEIKEAFYAVAQQVVVTVTPSITKLTDSIVEFLGKGGGAKEVADTIVASLKKLAEIAVQVYYAFDKFAQTAGYWYDRLVNGTPYNKQKWEEFKQGITDTDSAMQKALATVKNFQVAASDPTGGREGGKRAGQTDAPAIGVGNSAAQDALNKLQAEANRIIQQSLTPLQEYNDRVGELNKLKAAGLLTNDQYNQALDDAFTKYVKGEGALNKFTADTKAAVDQMQQYADTIKSAFGSWFDEILTGSFSAIDALKKLAVQLADIAANNVLSGLFASLTKPNNALYGGGGGLLAGLFGFASGGTIMAGGSGGVDSQLVAFRKSPDERVDITRPGQRLSSGSGGATNFYINAPGADTVAIARLERNIKDLVKNQKKTITNTVAHERQVSPGFA